jgi:UrcA family protein
MTIRKMSAFLSTATAAALTLSVACPGSAAVRDVTVRGQAPDQERLTELVSFADLDLASAAGEKQLSFRVGSAVKRVCAPHDQRHTFGEYGNCRSYAWSGAEPQIKLAVVRAQQLAATGVSAIAPVAIVIAAPLN